MSYNVVGEWPDSEPVYSTPVSIAAQILAEAYPGHPWHIEGKGGVLVIKHLKMSPKWGFIVHLDNVEHDAKVFKQRLVRVGGEFLERANLRRGGYDGTDITRVDGIPAKDMMI